MRFEIQVRDGSVVVSGRGWPLWAGDGDEKLSRALRGLLDAGARRVVLDLSRVHSTEGLSVEEVGRWGELFERAGATLVVVEPRGWSLWDLTELRAQLRLFPALEAAFAALRSAARVRLRGEPATLQTVLARLPKAV